MENMFNNNSVNNNVSSSKNQPFLGFYIIFLLISSILSSVLTLTVVLFGGMGVSTYSNKGAGLVLLLFVLIFSGLSIFLFRLTIKNIREYLKLRNSTSADENSNNIKPINGKKKFLTVIIVSVILFILFSMFFGFHL